MMPHEKQLTVIMYVLNISTIILILWDDVLLRKAFIDILNCCDIHFTNILSL